MIRNGEYYYPDFKKMIPSLIETFVEYYGEEHRPYIEKRLQEVDVYFFTGFESIESYVDEKLPAIRDRIIDEFLMQEGVKADNVDRVKDSMFLSVLDSDDTTIKTHALGDYSRLAVASLCSVDGFDTIFTDKEKKKILTLRDNICKTMGLNTNNPATKNLFISKLNEKRKLAYEKISLSLGSVGRDEHSVEVNERKATYAFYKYVDSIYPLSKRDKKKLALNNYYLLETLDAGDMYCGLDISAPGRVYDFSSEAEDILREGDPEQKDIIYSNRVRHFKLMGMDLHEKSSEDPETVYKRYIRAGAKRLGIPRKVADKIEAKRISLLKSINRDLSFVQMFYRASDKYLNELSLESTFNDLPNNHETNFVIENGKIKNRGVVSIDCDIKVLPDDILRTLIHELGHHLQLHILKMSPEKDIFECKDAISRRELFNIGMPDGMGDHVELTKKPGTLDNLMEYFNEKQAEELVKIYLSRFTNPFEKSDIDGTLYPYRSLYKKSDLLIGHIFDRYSKDIKTECISGRPVFSEPFGYKRLQKMDRILGEYYDSDLIYSEEIDSVVYDGAPFAHLPKDLVEGVMAFRKKIMGAEKIKV